MNVFDYFTNLLDSEPDDQTLKELPVLSVCGKDCCMAIDAAKAFILASDPHVHGQIKSTCFTTVEIFWRG